jgi:preprotein translocase subunit SecD
LEKKILLTGEFIRDAQVRFDPQTNQPYVSLSFDSIGADRFAKITRRSVGRNLAIVLDDKVQSAPVIREAITGGEASISGQFTVEEAGDLGLVLRSGSLPAPIEIREERTVGASLGEDSVAASLNALLLGGLFVLVFMAVYYRVSGLFAVAALVFNIILILSVLSTCGATLTLPGMAGIVLTIGMAVDANVLIFQRIREELRRTENPRAAIKEGFAKAFRTILDANVTTLFAALALLQFGTGPIKGFAVTLSIGILASMFTAIIVTRLFFDLVYLQRRQLKAISI